MEIENLKIGLHILKSFDIKCEMRFENLIQIVSGLYDNNLKYTIDNSNEIKEHFSKYAQIIFYKFYGFKPDVRCYEVVSTDYKTYLCFCYEDICKPYLKKTLSIKKLERELKLKNILK